jgi:hypothetical protein
MGFVPERTILPHTRVCVAATDDEMGAVVVFSHNGMPQGLPGTCHSHGKGQQAQQHHVVGVIWGHIQVAVNSGKIIDLPLPDLLGHRVEEQAGFQLSLQ